MEIAVVTVLFALLVEKAADSIYENHRAAIWIAAFVIAALLLGLMAVVYSKVSLLPVLLLF